MSISITTADHREPAQRPLVSVVIPCYKQAHFLPQALESVLAQTYLRVELIVVDDGSPDNTSEVACRHRDVRCIRQQNQGLSGARNTGLRESRGSFVMFLDADDRLLPNAVEDHLRCFAEHPEAGFVVGDIDQIDGSGAYKDSPRWPLLTSDFYEELLRVNHVANTIAVMFRREVFEKTGDFDTARSAAEDYELLLRTARLFPSAHHRTVVAKYRRYSTSMSRNGVLMLRSMEAVMRAQRRSIDGNPRLEAACRKGEIYWMDHFGTITVIEAVGHLRRFDFLRAAKALLGLLWYVRGRILAWPWKYRRRILPFVRRRVGAASRAQSNGNNTSAPPSIETGSSASEHIKPPPCATQL